MLKNNKAYTLIEILIAVAISMVVISAAYTVFFALKRGSLDVYELMKNREKVFNLLSVMRKEVESIYFDRKLPYSGIKVEENDFFGKPASKITFTSFFKEGTKVVSYFVEESEGTLNLYKKIYDPLKEDRAHRIIILRDIAGFRVVSYEDNLEKKVYNSENSQKIPEFVKISIYLKKGERDSEELSQICKLMVAR